MDRRRCARLRNSSEQVDELAVEQQPIDVFPLLDDALADASIVEIHEQWYLQASDALRAWTSVTVPGVSVTMPPTSVTELGCALLLPPRLIGLVVRSPNSRVLELRYRFSKRTFDIVLSLTLLIITMPLMIGAAVLVRATSRGPAFYSQVRCGRNGRSFKIIKLRSMVRDADRRVGEMAELARLTKLATTDAPAFKSADDPRVTRVGRMLRRTNLDELPQLLNILVGDMSFVGPRPLVDQEARLLTPDEAALRHAVRPGLTCLWQVVRSDETTFSERMNLDLAYVGSASGMLDLMLVAMTPRAVAGGHGCY
ncbi:MAG: sugar transferase [Ilumatobacteraceae bacterium]